MRKHFLRVAALSMAMTLFTSSGYALTLRYLQQGDDVAELQSALKQLGYYKETINGEYGTGTLNAVKAFQKTYGLTSDGVAGPKTLEKLEALTGIKIDGESCSGDPEDEVTQAPTEKPMSTPSPTPGATPSRTLRDGDTGEDVKLLQNRLIELGYLTGKADGTFDSATLAALKAFQKNNSLTADGVAGSWTCKMLFSSSAIGGGSGVNQTPTEKPTPTPSPTPGATPSRTLRYGDTGEDVKLLQNRLIELGYLIGKTDGTFDSATLTAVKAFQKNNSLTADGVAGSWTCKMLFSASAVEADPTSVDAVPTDGSVPRHP